MNKRQESSIRTRNNILEAGRRILNERQMDDVTIEDITREAGVSKGAFYLYFKSKSDLVCTLADGGFQSITDDAVSDGSPLIQRLSDYNERFVSIIVDAGREMCRNWTSEVVSSANDSKFQQDLTRMEGILSDAVSKGKLVEDAPVSDIAFSIVSSQYGAMMTWCLTGKDFHESARTVFRTQTVPMIERYSRS